MSDEEREEVERDFLAATGKQIQELDSVASIAAVESFRFFELLPAILELLRVFLVKQQDALETFLGRQIPNAKKDSLSDLLAKIEESFGSPVSGKIPNAIVNIREVLDRMVWAYDAGLRSVERDLSSVPKWLPSITAEPNPNARNARSIARGRAIDVLATLIESGSSDGEVNRSLLVRSMAYFGHNLSGISDDTLMKDRDRYREYMHIPEDCG